MALTNQSSGRCVVCFVVVVVVVVVVETVRQCDFPVMSCITHAACLKIGFGRSSNMSARRFSVVYWS